MCSAHLGISSCHFVLCGFALFCVILLQLICRDQHQCDVKSSPQSEVSTAPPAGGPQQALQHQSQEDPLLLTRLLVDFHHVTFISPCFILILLPCTAELVAGHISLPLLSCMWQIKIVDSWSVVNYLIMLTNQSSFSWELVHLCPDLGITSRVKAVTLKSFMETGNNFLNVSRSFFCSLKAFWAFF